MPGLSNKRGVKRSIYTTKDEDAVIARMCTKRGKQYSHFVIDAILKEIIRIDRDAVKDIPRAQEFLEATS